MTNSRAKGARGELEVISYLQPWWRRLEPETVFCRTPGSGGWARSSGLKARGDVMVDRESCKLFPFSVEVKREQRWDEHRFLWSLKPSPVWKWWTQCTTAAQKDGLRPLLWFRKNNAPSWYVMMEEAVHDRLHLRGMTPPLVRYLAPRHTVLLTHAQFLWFPPRAIVAACTQVTEERLAASYGFEGRAR